MEVNFAKYEVHVYTRDRTCDIHKILSTKVSAKQLFAKILTQNILRPEEGSDGKCV